MRAFDILLNLIFPPVCIFCKDALSYDSTEALCPNCRSRYESEKGFICPDCQKIHKECACLSKNMKRHGAAALHVAEYVKEESAVRAMILAGKESSYEYLYRFLASELAALVRARVPS